VDLLDLDPERAGERRERASGREGGEATPELDRAQHGRAGPVESAAVEGLAQHARIEASGMGHQYPSGQHVAHLLEDLTRLRCRLEHRLGDSREALDPAREGAFRPHQRVECVVQLPAAHEHGPHLGQLAEVAGEPVRLGVDREELGLGDWSGEQIHERPMQSLGPDGLQLGGEVVRRAP
jgi:hypothetical protein